MQSLSSTAVPTAGRGNRPKSSWPPLETLLPKEGVELMGAATVPGWGLPWRPADAGLDGLLLPPMPASGAVPMRLGTLGAPSPSLISAAKGGALGEPKTGFPTNYTFCSIGSSQTLGSATSERRSRAVWKLNQLAGLWLTVKRRQYNKTSNIRDWSAVIPKSWAR